MPSSKKQPVRHRRAIMIRPHPELLGQMEQAAAREGLSLNKLALEIIETSGRLGARKAAGDRADMEAALRDVEAAVRRLRSALE